MTLAIAAVAVTVVGALRSTWSPCGISMLSAMTPMAERARGHRYSLTAAWYLLGAIVGGATVGLVLAAASAGVGLLGVPVTVVAGMLAVLALVTAGSDLRIGPSLPVHRRQVDENWFGGYRRWVYASGFGWQIGNGVTTYTTTACLYLIAGTAVLIGNPAAAFAIGVTFGTMRGLVVLAGVPLTNLDTVRRVHAWLDRAAEPSRIATGVAQATVAFGLAITASPILAGVLTIVAVGATARRARLAKPAREPVSPAAPAGALTAR